MGVAALHFADAITRENLRPKRLLTSDMLDLSRLKGLCPEQLAQTQCVLIMHENQLSYPRREAEREDMHLGLTNLFSMWCSDLIWWNSNHHYELFMAKAADFIGLFPKRCPDDLLQRIEARSVVLGLPLDLGELRPLRRESDDLRRPGALRIAWNHRMAHDKNPDRVFGRLAKLARQGLEFELHLFGPRHESAPAVLAELDVVDHGYLERGAYPQRLAHCDLVVADPGQEHFGLSIAEAVQLGLWPLLPNGLCYPELIPKALHESCFFNDETDFARLLSQACEDPKRRFNPVYDRFEASQVVAQLCARLSSG